MAKLLHNNRLLYLLFGLIALAILLVFASVAYSAGNNHLLMPLDDVYIHFQYAKQMVLGQPYVYNPGQPATSGATSFLYPYLLAVGYFIGFKGLWLGLWAMLLGTLALIAAQWAVYRLCLAFDCPQWMSVLTAIIIALTGSFAWHFMSGMETGLMIALTLWTLLTVIEKHFRDFIVAATLLALMRPEGGILALVACATMVLRLWRDFGAHEKRPGKRSLLLLLLIPVAAIGVQPLVNLIMTGSTVATGNQAKSILATVPHDWGVIIGRIVDNFLRMWWEFVTGYDGREGRGWYLPLFTGLLGLCGIIILLFKRNWRLIGLMLPGWLLASTAAISTLDTAFWHFKRYQMPMLVLFFPLATFTVNQIIIYVGAQRDAPIRHTKYIVYPFYLAIIPIFAIAILLQFINYHRLNVGYVYQQPYQMVLWLHENTHEDAVIAVHDVGLMRYMGERTTLDIVGLTTPGAAAYWRNGPGSVAEFLINEQPDYIASYGRGHGYGLAYLADTSLYGEPLASFPIENWNRQANVALAADFQGIYQPGWDYIQFRGFASRIPIHRRVWSEYTMADNIGTLREINVADIQSEAEYDYSWSLNSRIGFPTEVRDMDNVVDGYRLINDKESFTLDLELDTAFVIVTRLHPETRGILHFYVDNVLVDTQWIPEMPGQWMNLSTLIHPDYIHEGMKVTIVADIPNGYYMPAFHSIRAYAAPGTGAVYPFPEEWGVIQGEADYQDGAFVLLGSRVCITCRLNELSVMVSFHSPNGATQGDYRFFLHVYDDVNAPPVLQQDDYFLGMPVGNWLPGTLSDTITLTTENLPNGIYSLAIGFYNPQTGERLHPTSDVYEVSPDGRLWLGEVTIGDEATDTQD
jgi:hypothetical protein